MYGNFVHATNDASHYAKPPSKEAMTFLVSKIAVRRRSIALVRAQRPALMHRSAVRPWLVMMTMERRVPGGTSRHCRISATIVFRRSSRASVVTINTRRGPGTPPSNHRPARCLVRPLCVGCRPVISAHYNSHVRKVRPWLLSSYHLRSHCTVRRYCIASHSDISQKQLECGPVTNMMAALPNIGGAFCLTPQSLAEAHYLTAMP